MQPGGSISFLGEHIVFKDTSPLAARLFIVFLWRVTKLMYIYCYNSNGGFLMIYIGHPHYYITRVTTGGSLDTTTNTDTIGTSKG